MEANTLLQFEKVQKVCNCREKWEQTHFCNSKKCQKCVTVVKNGSGHTFAIFASRNVSILGWSGGVPYCGYCVLAGTKREPTKQSLWEKQKRHDSNINSFVFSAVAFTVEWETACAAGKLADALSYDVQLVTRRCVSAKAQFCSIYNQLELPYGQCHLCEIQQSAHFQRGSTAREWTNPIVAKYNNLNR